jgi:hypothetical protein
MAKAEHLTWQLSSFEDRIGQVDDDKSITHRIYAELFHFH